MCLGFGSFVQVSAEEKKMQLICSEPGNEWYVTEESYGLF